MHLSAALRMLTNLAEAVRDVRTDDDLIKVWLEGVADTTKQIYRDTVRRLRAAIPKALTDITTVDVVAWYVGLGGAENTRDRHLAAVKSLLSFGHRAGLLPLDAGKPLKLRQRVLRRPDRVLNPQLAGELVTRAPAGRDRTLVEFVYATGARPMEVGRLTFEDLLDDRVLLNGKRGKRRLVPVGAALMADLRSLRQPDDDDSAHVFRSYRGRAMSRGTIWHVVKRIAEEVIAEDVPPYALRHSFATHAIDRGVAPHVLQKLLGHESLHTTSVYVHPPHDP